ncbi:MAG: RNA-binding domain-containing protein [Thermoplasmata archaeon]
MSILHNVRFRAYCHATEVQSRVESAMRFISGARELEHENLKGHHGNPLVKISAFLKRRKDLDIFLDKMAEAGVLQEILGTLDRSVDEKGSLHMRFSKQAAYEGRIEMTERDDAISVRAKVRAYPATKEEAIRLLKERLQQE